MAFFFLKKVLIFWVPAELEHIFYSCIICFFSQTTHLLLFIFPFDSNL